MGDGLEALVEWLQTVDLVQLANGGGLFVALAGIALTQMINDYLSGLDESARRFQRVYRIVKRPRR